MQFTDKCQRFYQYTRERFLFWQFILLSVIFSFTAGLLIQKWLHPGSIDFVLPTFAAVALFLFLLRLRLFDEFKDAEHDAVYYPDRPVPRGLIKLSELKPIIVVIIIAEFLISLKFFPDSLVVFSLTFLYSLLLFKEFFIAKWLKKRFTLYIFIHELIALPLFFYLLTLNGFHLNQINSGIFWPIILMFTSQLFLLEIARKTRSDDKQIGSMDTYTAQYGLTGATVLLFIVSLAMFYFYFWLIRGYHLISFTSYSPLLAFILYIFYSINFLLNPIKKNAKLVFISTIILVFVTDLIVIFLLVC